MQIKIWLEKKMDYMFEIGVSRNDLWRLEMISWKMFVVGVCDEYVARGRRYYFFLDCFVFPTFFFTLIYLFILFSFPHGQYQYISKPNKSEYLHTIPAQYLSLYTTHSPHIGGGKKSGKNCFLYLFFFWNLVKMDNTKIVVKKDKKKMWELIITHKNFLTYVLELY